MNRRDFLRLSGTGFAGLVLAQFPNIAATAQDIEADVEIVLTAIPEQVQILPGQTTSTWRYIAEVIRGDPNSVQSTPNSYFGPILRFRKGQQVRIHLNNQLPESTITHWHGLTVPETADGHPRFAIETGETYTYDFQVINRAGTYWYHPHPHGRTGPQVYAGLAGFLFVSDEEEDALGLPEGDYEIPLMLQDRVFDADNQMVYLPNGMMDRMHGFLGDRMMVNGQADYALSVEKSAYRLRLLNGSNSRVYKLAWDDGTPLIVIGTDGGLLQSPIEKDYIMLAPSERLDLWVDFSTYPVGTSLSLKSLTFSGAEEGGMGTSEFTILTVNVDSDATSTPATLPAQLSTPNFNDAPNAVNAANPRQFTVAMQAMAATINGQSFEMTGVDANEIVQAGDLEVWEFINPPSSMGRGMGRGMGMVMPHPMHIHNVQFQVIDRQIDPDFASIWDTVREGYVDGAGWKDSVLLMPGERVKVLVKFPDYTGLYLYHCHNLEHEDLGLMRNYRIE
ncbi:MAG: multicopper oxidase domain-containing protein [Anaerolineae bacterium]|nr:multicopper oxidase domain-containing protein [Anaerolineae bacterium]